ncbi:MAG: tetratricopeptide repeat-containing sensor histidine kinase [Flammeovirgaceae bacterium]
MIHVKYIIKQWQGTISIAYYLLYSIGIAAQPNDVIQQLHVQAASVNDSLRAAAFNELAWEYRRINLDSAEYFANQALDFASQKQIKTEHASSFVRKGLIAKYRGDYREAITYYKSAWKLRTELNDQKGTAGVLNNIGTIYNQLGNYDSAIYYFSNALTIREAIHDQKGIIKILKNRGNMWEKQREYQKAKADYDYGKKLLLSKTTLSRSDSLEISQFMHNLGVVSFRQQKFEEAIVFYRQSMLIKEKYRDVKGLLLSLEAQISCLKETQQSSALVQLIPKYQKIITQIEQLGSKPELITALNNLAECYQLIGQKRKALSYYKQAEKIAQETQARDDLNRIYFNLAQLYHATGDLSLAIDYQFKYISLHDSLFNEEKHKIITDIQTKYETEKKEKALIQSQLQNQSTKLQLQATAIQRNTFVGLMIFVAMLGGYWVWYYYLKRKNSLETLALSQEYDTKRFDDLLKLQERNTSKAMMEGEEQERKRIAKELHDNINNLLTVVKIHFDSLEGKIGQLESRQVEHFHQASTTLHETATEIERMSKKLASGTLNRFGLEAAIYELEDIFQPATTMKIEVDTHGLQDRFKPDVELNLYRIAQELLGNALKHAQADYFSLQITQRADELNMIAEDDGVGFDLEQVKSKGRNGLVNIQARVDELGGKLMIDSVKGKSTHIIIEIPIENLS